MKIFAALFVLFTVFLSIESHAGSVVNPPMTGPDTVSDAQTVSFLKEQLSRFGVVVVCPNFETIGFDQALKEISSEANYSWPAENGCVTVAK